MSFLKDRIAGASSLKCLVARKSHAPKKDAEYYKSRGLVRQKSYDHAAIIADLKSDEFTTFKCLADKYGCHHTTIGTIARNNGIKSELSRIRSDNRGKS